MVFSQDMLQFFFTVKLTIILTGCSGGVLTGYVAVFFFLCV